MRTSKFANARIERGLFYRFPFGISFELYLAGLRESSVPSFLQRVTERLSDEGADGIGIAERKVIFKKVHDLELFSWDTLAGVSCGSIAVVSSDEQLLIRVQLAKPTPVAVAALFAVVAGPIAWSSNGVPLWRGVITGSLFVTVLSLLGMVSTRMRVSRWLREL